ncbi:MAG: NHLP family bacteriocin export ABC transporter peptidase/permease/ATPase subunit [Schwartzia sp.]|nr:NHLP family bacteriocin export ABC transporter peptidase/permease/ATPase subunit [Schwartzia sp. (in: firmicutes)]
MIEKIKDYVRRLPFFGGKRVDTPTILQMEAVECGAASLAMVMAYYGLWLPLEKLRQECGVTRDGSNARNIMKAARRFGMTADGHAANPRSVFKKPLPLILFWEFNHFVVLEGRDGKKIYINDPAMGKRTVSWEDFVGSFTGVFIDVKPGPEFKKAGHPYSVVAAIAKKLMEDKSSLVYILLLGFFMILPGLAAPVFDQIFLDEIFTLKHADWMTQFSVAMLAMFLFAFAMNWTRAFILTRWEKKLILVDSSKFFWHVIRLPLVFFQQRYAADVAARVQFNEDVAQVLSNQAATAALDFLVALFYLGLLLQYSVPLTLIGMIVNGVNLAVFFYMRRRLTDLTMRIQKDMGKEFGAAVNGLSIIESIKATGSESELFGKWAGYHAKALMSTQEVQQWALKVKLLPSFLMAINGALIITFGGFSIMEGVMTAGIFTAFQNLMAEFQAPFNKLLLLGDTLRNTEMQMRQLDDVRRYEEDSLNYPREEQKVSFTGDRLSGELELVDVSFGYSPLEPPLLEHFSMKLEPGGWVAVVGSSGSGKSTLAKIITGLYEEWSGDVLLDGVKRREIPRSVIVNSISSVDQDIFQITGTIQENIALFDKSIKRSDILAAAQDACIHDDILQIEGGYDAMVSEGGLNFSGGQRQRLEIARALAGNPSLLVLDEATSALDPLTEQTLLANLRRRGCSCFIVAHRLSTIRDADEIIVLDHGKIVERGRHHEMMQHDGPYRRLIEEQDKQNE